MNNNLANHHQALFDSIKVGAVDVLQHYLNNGITIHIQNAQGQTPLLCAIDANNMAAIDALLASDAGKALLTVTDGQGNTALHYAVAARNDLLIQRLYLTEGIDKQRRNQAGESAADWIQLYQFEFYSGQNALPQKIAAGHLEAVKALLIKEVPFSLRYQGGDTALHIAIRHNQSRIVKEILKYADSDLLNIKNFSGQTPLALAEHIKTVEQIDNNIILDLLSGAELGILGTAFLPLPPIPEIDAQKVVELSDLLTQAPSPENVDRFKACLPTLVKLAQTVAQETVQILQDQLTGERNLSEQQDKLIKILVGENYNTSDLMQLKRKITAMVRYFDTMQTNESIDDHIKFVFENRYRAEVRDEIIFLNVNMNYQYALPELINLLLHESSHVVNESIDFGQQNSNTEYTEKGDAITPVSQLGRSIALNGGGYVDSRPEFDMFNRQSRNQGGAERARILITQAMLSDSLNTERFPKLASEEEYPGDSLEGLYAEERDLKNKVAEESALKNQFSTLKRNLAPSEAMDQMSEQLATKTDEADDQYKRVINIRDFALRAIKKPLALSTAEVIANLTVGLKALESNDACFDEQDNLVYKKGALATTLSAVRQQDFVNERIQSSDIFNLAVIMASMLDNDVISLTTPSYITQYVSPQLTTCTVSE